MGGLEGRRALVTGGTSGIGAAVVRRFAREGARVVFTGRSRERGDEVARETGAALVVADVRNPDDIQRSVDEAAAILGGLDVAVLNAGVLADAPLSDTDDATWDGIIETNLVAPFRYARATMGLLEQSGGSMVLTASDAGVWGETAIGAYSVSKRGVIMLTRMLAVEAGPRGVRVNAVDPGDCEPGMVTTVAGRDELPDTATWVRPPLGTLVNADDVAAAIAFLASEDARTITGTDLLIDGGMRSAARANSVWQERTA
jgi:NAD(P)-dependent dehydrogenase (short-subunit alcohol dehydrogenase family)